MGQARAQARHPVHTAMSTSRKPAERAGSMSATRFSVRSGYWMVMGRRSMCDRVTDRTLPERLHDVRDGTEVMCEPFQASIVWVTQFERSPGALNHLPIVLARAQGEFTNRSATPALAPTPEPGARTRGTITQKRVKMKQAKAGNQVLPAQRHHLIHTHARQGPAQPDENRMTSSQVLTATPGSETLPAEPSRWGKPRCRALIDHLHRHEGDLPAAQEQGDPRARP